MPRRWLSPDFFSDEKMKRATVPERLLGAALIANQDDDGRLRGDPNYLRAIAFLYDNYSLDEVREMRNHLAQVNPNIIVYQNVEDEYIQLKQYRRFQNPRYYHPSKFPSPPGWPFEEEEKPPVTKQRPPSNLPVTKQQPRKREKDALGKGKELDLNKDKGLGKGAKRHPLPSPPDLCTDINKIINKLVESFRYEWGRVLAEKPGEIIPREPGGKDLAQLGDLAEELVAAGGCPLSYIREAFREAAGQGTKSKMSISYVRAILFDWLGIPRAPPG